MSHVVHRETESAGDSTIICGVTRQGIDAHTASKHFSNIVPNGGSVRSLQAAAEPSRYNLQDYPTLAKHAEEITYEREEVTMSEAKDDPDLRGRITGDDEFEFNDDDVVFIRHTWSIPSGLTQMR